MICFRSRRVAQYSYSSGKGIEFASLAGCREVLITRPGGEAKLINHRDSNQVTSCQCDIVKILIRLE